MHFIFDIPQVYFLEKRKQKLRFWNPSDSRAIVNVNLTLYKTSLNTIWNRLDHSEYIIYYILLKDFGLMLMY